jgi:hypothetical protein
MMQTPIWDHSDVLGLMPSKISGGYGSGATKRNISRNNKSDRTCPPYKCAGFNFP